jgi:hypothetical protein
MFAKPDYWVIVDDVIGDAASHQIDVRFQFAPMNVSIVGERWARADTPGGNTLWIGTVAPGAVTPHVKAGECVPICGWVSADYGQRTPAPQLIFTARTTIPWRGITLLMPQRGKRVAPPSMSALFDDHNLPIGIELEDRSESIFADDTDIYR